MKTLILAVLLGLVAAMPAWAQNIQLTATTTGTLTPEVIGKTNLPDGTKLSVGLACPLMYCAEYWSNDVTAVVHGSAFETAPFLENGKPLPVGRYVISVVLLAEQDQPVMFRLFDLGWNRTQVVAFDFTVDVR
ncbi:MAG: hypothetical protein KGJ32_13530 [Xanthomonadaceae bacterium]|nr:hypothetical protein [Xanthomonadaceae bacterium]